LAISLGDVMASDGSIEASRLVREIAYEHWHRALFARFLAENNLLIDPKHRVATELGVAPADDRDGCLQDVHWYSGYIGGRFHSYTIGNILSAQFYAAALQAHPNIASEIASGKFDTLHTWLRDSVYQHGSKFAPNHLIERATGAAMNMTPYFDYLREKYAVLYRLPVSFGGDSGTLPSLP
jgi:carboxypeptidase Taq